MTLHLPLLGLRRSRLDHDSNRPADGFHPFLSWRTHWLAEPFLLVVALFFLTVAVAPASAFHDSLAVGRSLSDEISGITPDMLARQSESDPMAASKVSPEVRGSHAGIGPAMLSALARLPEIRGVWLLAAAPWIWSVITWYSRPTRRRVRRRIRY